MKPLLAISATLFGLMTLTQAPLVKADGHASPQQEVMQKDPQQMIQALSQRLIKELNINRELYENSASEVKRFATENVLPFIDTPKMARYVLGKHWRSATDAQQQEFVEAFTNTLIRSYSQSLLKLNIESVEVSPAREEKPGRVTVESTVAQKGGNKSQVIYRMYLNKDSQNWMLYDVTVEGISLLLSYRKAYDSDISRKGLDVVIDEMHEKNADFNGQV